MRDHIIRAVLYQDMSVKWKDAELNGDVNVHLNVHQKTRQIVEAELDDFLLSAGEVILVAFEKTIDREFYHENPTKMDKIDPKHFRLQIPTLVHNTPGVWEMQFFLATEYNPITGSYTDAYPFDKVKFSEHSSIIDDGLTVPTGENLKELYRRTIGRFELVDSYSKRTTANGTPNIVDGSVTKLLWIHGATKAIQQDDGTYKFENAHFKGIRSTPPPKNLIPFPYNGYTFGTELEWNVYEDGTIVAYGAHQRNEQIGNGVNTHTGECTYVLAEALALEKGTYTLAGLVKGGCGYKDGDPYKQRCFIGAFVDSPEMACTVIENGGVETFEITEDNTKVYIQVSVAWSDEQPHVFKPALYKGDYTKETLPKYRCNKEDLKEACTINAYSVNKDTGESEEIVLGEHDWVNPSTGYFVRKTGYDYAKGTVYEKPVGEREDGYFVFSGDSYIAYLGGTEEILKDTDNGLNVIIRQEYQVEIVGIQRMALVGTNTNGDNIYMITHDNGRTSTIFVPKGKQGEKGEQGEKGDKGDSVSIPLVRLI